MRLLVPLAFAALAAGCFPYSMGQTAATVPPGAPAFSVTASAIPVTRDATGPSDIAALPQLDLVGRVGVGPRTDATVRAVGLGGSVAIKHQLVGRDDYDDAVSVLADAGLLNGGIHGYVGGAVLVSGGDANRIVPYGGLRAFQVVRLRDSDDVERGEGTSVGAFAGLRIGTLGLGVSPEIGVYADGSLAGLRDNTVVVVPSLTLHGRLTRILR